jgi:hypothetical protein
MGFTLAYAQLTTLLPFLQSREQADGLSIFAGNWLCIIAEPNRLGLIPGSFRWSAASSGKIRAQCHLHLVLSVRNGTRICGSAALSIHGAWYTTLRYYLPEM